MHSLPAMNCSLPPEQNKWCPKQPVGNLFAICVQFFQFCDTIFSSFKIVSMIASHLRGSGAGVAWRFLHIDSRSADELCCKTQGVPGQINYDKAKSGLGDFVQ